MSASRPEPKPTSSSEVTPQLAAKEPISFIDQMKDKFNALTMGLAILSVVLGGLSLYLALPKAPNPTYVISEERSQIFNSTISSPSITVLDKDGRLIKDDVYLATVTFWNAGHESIKAEDVIKPVHLRISSIKQLLDYSITDKIDKDLANFKLKLISEPSENSEDAEIELYCTMCLTTTHKGIYSDRSLYDIEIASLLIWRVFS